jgi:hypothetical protein
VAADFDLQVNSVRDNLPAERQDLKTLLLTYIPPGNYDAQKGPLLTDRFNPVEYLVARTMR